MILSELWQGNTENALVNLYSNNINGCVVAWPTTAPGATLWSISILPHPFSSEQLQRAICTVYKAELFLLLIDVPTFKSARYSPKGMSPCMHDDVTIIDECKQGTALTSNIHVNNAIQMSIFRKSESANSIISSLCEFTMLSKVCISDLQREKWQSHCDRGAIFSTFTRGLCACNARLVNDDVSAISSCPIAGEGDSPNYAWLMVVEW